MTIVAEKKAQGATLPRNPEIDAKLDRFIASNSDLREYYEQLSKDEGDRFASLVG